jgi:hypothetical protein
MNIEFNSNILRLTSGNVEKDEFTNATSTQNPNVLGEARVPLQCIISLEYIYQIFLSPISTHPILATLSQNKLRYYYYDMISLLFGRLLNDSTELFL